VTDPPTIESIAFTLLKLRFGRFQYLNPFCFQAVRIARPGKSAQVC